MENLSSTVQNMGEFSPLLDSPAAVDPMIYSDVLLFRKVTLTLWLAFSIAGSVTNVINLHTFLKMGLDDSVTISFFFLAISDFFNCSLMLLVIACMVWEILEFDSQSWALVNPSVPTVFIEVVRNGFATITVLVTTFLAVQRCLCVLVPFRVKGMFTKTKTYAFLVICYLVCFMPLAFYLSRYEVGMVPHVAILNASQLGLTILPDSEPYFFVADFLLGIVINFGGQAIVVASLVLIFVTLKKSLRFRQGVKANVSFKGADDDKEQATDAKEMQALKQVGLLCLTFVCTNSPFVALVIARLSISEFNLYQEYHNLFLFVYVPIFITEMLGSNMNIFIYYKYNTKFRDYCVLTPKK